MPGSLQERGLFRFQHEDDSDSGSERVKGGSSRNVTVRSSGACVHCKSLKVRCEPIPGEDTCQRCRAANIACLARTRKKRKPAPTHEDLQEKAHNQDCQIHTLLLQLDQLKHENEVKLWKSRAYSESRTMRHETGRHLKNWEQPSRNRWTNLEGSPEIAISTKFGPGRSLPGLTPPEIVRHCALYPDDISELFQIYFEKVDPFFSILDQELHTPENLIWTCPFLFTVICSTASRYCTSKPGLYPLAREFARDLAGKALIDGSKSIDVCQAYLILAVYPVPKKRWAEDRSWLLMGVAIRLAMELELDRPPPPNCDEREALNRTRTWLNCYCVDGSHAIQFGKRPMLQLDDYLAIHSESFYHSSPMNIAYDVHLCAYVQMIRIMAEWKAATREEDLPQKIRDGFDVVTAAIETEERLSNELTQWVGRYKEEYALKPMLICAYRGNTTQMITAYLRLVVLAMGFQHAVKSDLCREADILKRSIDAARTVIQIMVERLSPTPFLRYAMEAHFLYVSFSAAYLVNLLRPTLLHLLDEDTQEDIVFTVNKLIEVLKSKEVVLDGRHTPVLYSRFLSSLLAKYNVQSPRRSLTPQDGVKFYPQYGNVRQVSPPGNSWPDIRQSNGYFQAPDESYSSDRVYQHTNEVDMDFSFTHFVRTVNQDSTSFVSDNNSWNTSSWSGRQNPALMNGWPSHSFASEWGQ